MKFLLSRRWALFALVVVVLAYGCYLLGQWQFHRLEDRESRNAQTRTNLAAEPAPVGDVLAVGRGARAEDEWRRVTATGTYDAAATVVVRYQTRDGGSGVDLVTPLRTEDGPALLVDRGWTSTGNTGTATVEDAPAPPTGRVTVVGWVRQDATGDATAVHDRSTRAVSSQRIGETLDYPVYGGFVDAERETPPPATRLEPAELPDLGNGPHFFYGLQWWFFGVLAVFGFFYLAYDERRRLRRPADGSEETAAEGDRQPDSEPVTGDPVTGPEASHRRRAASRR